MRVLSLSLLLTLFALIGKAQISITFPMEKAVFQRNLSNQANINIAGNYSSAINSVQAQLKNYATNNVVNNFGWTTISNSPSNGIFQGTLSNVPGGWYILEVRGLLNGNVVGSVATLQRVGVGEVFIIAGQSNAQGQPGNYAEVGATDERVLSHNETTFLANSSQCNLNFPNYPSFSQIFSDGNTQSNLSKTGYNPWCYGKLGDLLLSRFGVPIVFYNAGYEGSTSLNWKQSADGLATYSYFTGQQYCQAVGAPYYGLKRVLNYYASVFGARAVIWHQGETDNNANTTYSDYINNVDYVINKSRSDLGSTIPWVISQVSVNDKNANGGNGNPNSNIINAQIALVNNSNKKFSGPSTDDILGGNRLDQVHFYGAGLIELANRWNAALDANFFNNATPITAKPLPSVSVTCLNTTTFRLTAPAGYVAYKWVRPDMGNPDIEDAAEATTQIIDRSAGTYRCYLTDNQGNITFTQAALLPDVTSTCGTPPPPTCTGLTSCSGITYLSNSQPCSSTNGWGPIEMDKSNGESAAGDGITITLKGIPYTKGIGVHAVSEIVYKLNGNFGRFISDLGIDDEAVSVNSVASVVYKVYKDNVLAYTSPLISKTTGTVRINIPTSGTNELKMVVEDGGNGINYDHADWAGARLHCTTVDNSPPSAPTSAIESNVGQNCVTLTWNASTDNIEVDKYNIYRDGNLIGSVNTPFTTFRVTGLSALTYYTFRIRAVDFSGNISSESNLVDIVTLQNPFISTNKKIINVGQTSQLLAFGCNGGIVTWSTGATTNPINVSPTDTTIYTATCTVGTCVSPLARDTVKVIPNCKTNYSLIKNKDNLSGSTTLTFSASQTISATNIISSPASVAYKAAKSVTLLPGFQASSGTVFSATIAGCVNGARVDFQTIPPTESQPADKSKMSPMVEKEE